MRCLSLGRAACGAGSRCSLAPRASCAERMHVVWQRPAGPVGMRQAARRGRRAQVCAASGVSPDEVVYVEAHGTGTVVGDSQELSAIDGLYGAGAGHTPRDPLLIGSVKSNMGHCEGCSGLAGAQAPRAWHSAASRATAPLWYTRLRTRLTYAVGTPCRAATRGACMVCIYVNLLTGVLEARARSGALRQGRRSAVRAGVGACAPGGTHPTTHAQV